MTPHAKISVQEGQIGLLLAIDLYDPSRGTRFSTYAAFWMRAYMLRYLERHRSQVQGGEERRGVMCDFPSTHRSRSTRKPFISTGWWMTVRTRRRTAPGTRNDVSSPRRWSDSADGLAPSAGTSWLSRWVQDSPETLESLGKRWGVSREWVRQLENRAKVLLTRHLEAQAA